MPHRRMYLFLSPEVPGFWPSKGFVAISLISELIDGMEDESRKKS